MATIEITVRDEAGNVLKGPEKPIDVLDVDSGSFPWVSGQVDTAEKKRYTFLFAS
jgi:hypothetical protein